MFAVFEILLGIGFIARALTMQKELSQVSPAGRSTHIRAMAAYAGFGGACLGGGAVVLVVRLLGRH